MHVTHSRRGYYVEVTEEETETAEDLTERAFTVAEEEEVLELVLESDTEW